MERDRAHERDACNGVSAPSSLWLVAAAFGAILLLGLWTAVAQAVDDSDSDLVPDAFDNCLLAPNGANEPSNQVDSDVDGYGNACDADYTDDFIVSTADLVLLLTDITGPGTETDHDGNGIVTVTDFAVFLSQFGLVPGPSGLACAGTVPCLP